jgi:hypothetical protein
MTTYIEPEDATDITGELAYDHVKDVVTRHWYSKLQKIDVPNDDGVDGMLLLYKKYAVSKTLKSGEVRSRYERKPTGGLFFLQIKGGEGYRVERQGKPGFVCLQLKTDYIASHRPRWNCLPGPVLLVFVDIKSSRREVKSWWVDLKDEATYDAGNERLILIPRKQTFGSHSKGEFRRLQARVGQEVIAAKLSLSRSEVNFVRPQLSVKAAAKALYRAWATSADADRTNPALGVVTVSRCGWRHMTRKGRRAERIMQSLLLLPVARKAVPLIRKFSVLGRAHNTPGAGGTMELRDYVGIRVEVSFPHRASAIVQVVLRRRRRYNAAQKRVEQTIWFLSVYEKTPKR